MYRKKFLDTSVSPLLFVPQSCLPFLLCWNPSGQGHPWSVLTTSHRHFLVFILTDLFLVFNTIVHFLKILSSLDFWDSTESWIYFYFLAIPFQCFRNPLPPLNPSVLVFPISQILFQFLSFLWYVDLWKTSFTLTLLNITSILMTSKSLSPSQSFNRPLHLYIF